VIALDGILAPVVTPFDQDGLVDDDAFVANVRAHLAAGLHGIVVAGSTGEAALLDESERERLVALARDAVPRDRTLLVGTGAESTRAVIARNRTAAAHGADAVLVVAPHYYGDAMTAEALRDHYRRIADTSPVPVLLYTIPKYMHFALPADVVAELAEHENIVGMKDSSGDAALLRGYLPAQSDSFKVLTGSGSLLREALGLGAHGAILAVALFAPALSLDVLRSAGDAHATDATDATAVQARLTPLAARIVGGMGVAGVKAALDAVGLHGGAPRPPLRPLAPAARETLQALMQTAELAGAR
jgi:4-hydroxy-2-oxoglutarate aldolase